MRTTSSLLIALALMTTPIALADHDGGGEVEDICQPHPEDPDALVCHPPEECEGQVYETPECTPPPECHDNGDGTFTCYPPDDEYQEDHGDETYDELPPECQPHPQEEMAIICYPPEECQDQLYDTEFCTPPPECHDNGDGTFTCYPPEGEGGLHQDSHHDEGPDAYDGPCGPDGCTTEDLFGEDELFEEDPSDWEGAREAARLAIRSAMDGFQSTIESLKADHQANLEDLRQRYDAGKAELKADYQACLDEARASDGQAALDAAEACRQAARDGLRDLRETLMAENEENKAALLMTANERRVEVCTELQSALQGILIDHGILDTPIEALVPPGEIGLCADQLHGGGHR